MLLESDNKICPKGILLSLIIPFLLLTAKPEQNQGLSESACCLETKTFCYHCIHLGKTSNPNKWSNDSTNSPSLLIKSSTVRVKLMSNSVYHNWKRISGKRKKSKSEVLTSFLSFFFFFIYIFFCIMLMLVSQA